MTTKHYALKGIIRGQHVTTEVRFSAPESDDPWEVADTVSLPPGFMTTMLVEVVGRRHVNVPLSPEAIRAALDGITGRVLGETR
jgi:hypothetical protein